MYRVVDMGQGRVRGTWTFPAAGPSAVTRGGEDSATYIGQGKDMRHTEVHRVEVQMGTLACDSPWSALLAFFSPAGRRLLAECGRRKKE
jgi:hypothetical protein